MRNVYSSRRFITPCVSLFAFVFALNTVLRLLWCCLDSKTVQDSDGRLGSSEQLAMWVILGMSAGMVPLESNSKPVYPSVRNQLE